MHSKHLDFAFQLADAADAITMRQFGSHSLLVDRKPDRTFVTEADRAAELAIRKLVEADRPDEVVTG